MKADTFTLIKSGFACITSDNPQYSYHLSHFILSAFCTKVKPFLTLSFYIFYSELPLPCGTVVPMEVASNSRDSSPFLTKRLAVRTNQDIFTYAAIPLTGIPFGFSLWNPYTSGAERNV